jgi:hypothetical protein
MGTKLHTSTSTTRALFRAFLPLIVALSLLASQLTPFAIQPASAVAVSPGTDGGGFEIDGNYTVDGTGTTDWVPRLSQGAFSRADATGGGDDQFVSGSSAKEGDRASWRFEMSTGGGQGKVDLSRVYFDVDVEHEWLRVGYDRVVGQGDAWVAFELNQLGNTPVNGLHSIPTVPADGDLRIAFFYGGQGQTDSYDIVVDEWRSGGWQTVTTTTGYGAVYRGPGITNPFGAPIGDRMFGEAAVDISFLFDQADGVCRSFGQAWARSRASASASANLEDVVAPFEIAFDTCSNVTLRKVDDQDPPQPLAGAEFDVYAGATATGTPILTCTTGADGYCVDPDGVLDELAAGPYTFVEVAPPAGFKLSDPTSQTITLGQNESRDVRFANPPITYLIDVDPEDDTNAVGFTHEFTVQLTADYVFDHETGAIRSSAAADIPLAGETVDLTWAGPPTDSGIVDVDGTGHDKAGSATCTTDDAGTCTVTVLSDDVGGPGTLTATYATPLGGPAASEPSHTTAGGYFSAISDAGQKSWIGYRAELEGDFDNPLGEAHTFTATVHRVNANGSETVAADVDVSFDWDGPAGSGFDGAASCTTDALGSCDVTISSPTAAGEGTLTITEVSGFVVPGEQLVIVYDGEHAPSATKTWWDYRATIDGDSTNPVGEEHTFTVTVERTDGSGWIAVPDGTTLDVSWDPVGDNDSEITGNRCAAPGTVGGACDVTVTTQNVGLGTLTVVGIAGTTLGDHLDGAAFPFAFDEGPQASKLWVDWEAHISYPAENPAGEPHTFAISVQVYDGEGYVDVPDGTIVGLTLGASDLSLITVVEDTCADPGTEDGECTLTVVADQRVVLDVEVTSVDDTVIEDGGVDRNVSFEFADPVSSSKEWIDYRIRDDEDAVNLAGDPHTFTLTAQERREGEGWQPLEGVTLDVRLEPGSVGEMDASDCTTGGTDAAGRCTVTVSSDVAGSATVIADAINGVDLLDGSTASSTTSWDVDVREADQTKTWLEYDVTVSDDAVNNIGDDHDFTVTVTVDDGTGPVPATTATVTGVFTYDDDGTFDVDCTTGAAGTCTISIPAPTDGDGPLPGSGVLVLDEVAHTFDGTRFTVDLAGSLGLDADFEQPTATKVWIDYALVVTPPAATNLLPAYPEHTYTVSLWSSDSSVAPYAGQTIDLELDSEVAAIIEIVDAGGSRTFDPEEGVVSESCTTPTDGTCEVTVVSSTPGTADLTARFAATVGDATFDVEATGSKLWTSFRVSVNPQNAQNLLGTPHLFTVTIEQTEDGERFTPVAGAIPTLAITAPAFIVDTDCDEGTAADGTCTATVDSETAGVFTFTAEYLGVVGDQSAAFSDTGEKGWIDYQVEVTPDVAENLIDTDHVFTVTVSADLGAGWVPVTGAMPDLDLDGPGLIVAEDCSDGTDDDGTCTVTIRSADPGLSTLTATYLGAAGGGDHDNPTETAPYVDSGAKLWVDYLLEVTPATAINALDDPHTYTVTLRRDEGEEPLAVVGETVDVAISGPGTITTASGGTIAEDGRSATCTTDTDGTCQVTIVSGTPGTTTVTASYAVVVGETSGTYTATAEKHWAAIELVKTALVDEDDHGFKTVTYSTDPDVGAPVITYEYTITNTGPVTLTVTSLEDDVLGTITLPDPLVLEPGASETVTADHVVDRDDADAGEIYNVATVEAVAADGTQVSDRDDEEVLVITVLATGSIDLVKSALVDRDDDGNRTFEVRRGESATVTYRYLITNNGNVPLSDLHLVDDKIGEISVPDVTLEPGESITVDATYTVTAADLAAGEIENVAVVTGSTPDGVQVTDEDDEIVFPVEVLPVVITPPTPEPARPTPEPAPLPRTGVDAGVLLTLGLLMAAIGAAALTFTPRQHRRER